MRGADSGGSVNVGRILQFLWQAALVAIAVIGLMFMLKMASIYQEGLTKARKNYEDNVLAMMRDCPNAASNRIKRECMTTEVDSAMSPYWLAFDYLYSTVLTEGLLHLHIVARSAWQLALACGVVAALIMYLKPRGAAAGTQGALPTTMFFSAPPAISQKQLQDSLRDAFTDPAYKPKAMDGFSSGKLKMV